MVAHLLRLKLTLLRNSLKRSPWQIVGMVVGGLYGLGILALVLAGLVVLGATDDVALARTIVILAGSAVLLGWLIIPVIAAGVDMTLDPARFTTFAIPLPTLLVGLALSGFLGIPGAITLLASLGTVAAWWRHPVAAVSALFCAVLAVLTCIVASRAMTAASTSLSSSRRFKDLSGLLVLVPLVFLGPIVGGLGAGLANAGGYLSSLAGTLSWTPLGAVWAVPADLAAGATGAAGVKLLIALATLAVLAWIWKVCLAKALVTPPFNAGTRRAGGRLGFFRYFPPTPTGVVAARALTYWFRDPRYSAGLVLAPLLPFVFVLAGAGAGGFAALNFAGPLAVFLLVWSISADISYDNSAFALHVATGVRGAADRGGRALACGVLALTLGVLYSIAGAAVNNSWAYLPGTLGLTLGVIGSGLGLASVFSARFTYNVPAPGDSPLKSKPGNGCSTMLIQLAGFLGLGLLVLPELVLSIVGLVMHQPLLSWIALAVAAVLGTTFLVLGLRIGGRLYDRRSPELLLAVAKTD